LENGNACRDRTLQVIKSYFALYPRIGGRERLVGGLLHMVENDQPDHGENDRSKASSKKSLHGMLPSSI